jgi:hypothetical protein
VNDAKLKIKRPTVSDSWQDASSSLNKAAVEFLIADLTVALTFLEVADASLNLETKQRNHRNARTAYDMVVRLLPTIRPEKEQQVEIDQKLKLLKTRLVARGGSSEVGPLTERCAVPDSDFRRKPAMARTSVVLLKRNQEPSKPQRPAGSSSLRRGTSGRCQNYSYFLATQRLTHFFDSPR